MKTVYKKILWLTPANFTGGLKFTLEKYLKSIGLDSAPIHLRCFSKNCLKKTGKKNFTWDQSKYKSFENAITKFNPDFIVCNDTAALGFLTQKYTSLALTRGSIYKFNSIPFLVIDSIHKTKSTSTGSWIFKQDLLKLKRWITAKQRHQQKFRYKVCENKTDLDQLKNSLSDALLIGTDIETSGRGRHVKITCSGYTVLSKSGKIFTWVIPFVDTTKSDGCFWRSKNEEIYAMKTMAFVHASKPIKVLQNGSYDATHVITYHMPYNNYILDTLHLFHSIYIESPKRLDFITSLCLDFYRYWKDESKEAEEDTVKDIQIPQTTFGLRNYWRYNALDCYYTLMNSLFLLKFIQQPQMKWALDNYLKEFSNQTGPDLACSLRGCKWNTKIQAKLNMSLLQKSESALKDLKTMVGDSTFNPGSPKQVAELVYDILGAEPIPRQKRKTGEPVLKLVQTQHPLLKKIINQIWEYKKPLNNASKYGELQLLNQRFMYKVSAAGTETGRKATKSSDFWLGSNVQNVPESMRIMFEPDPGYFLFDFDYSQSDAYFTAFESEDPKFMATMLSDKDTHCIHAEHFFQIPYQKLADAKKNHEEWCVHKTTGVRSVTKRAVYGANYLMAGYTLFITMGQDAVIAAAIHLGYKDAGSWNFKQLVFLCTKLIEKYFELYPVLPVWLTEQIAKVSENSNLSTCYGGLTRLFFKDLRTDTSGQRELASFYGQGGTAGNINAFMADFYYNNHDSSDIMLLFQVHDSIVGQVRIDKLEKLIKLKSLMERICEIHGRKFIVPVEGSIGLGWGKRMLDWDADIKKEKVFKHDREWWKKWNKK